jgi:vancomycin resistance protein YoaR
MKKKIFGLAGIALLSAICLLGGSQPAQAAIGVTEAGTASGNKGDTIEEGVYIGNVNVGGMTEAQARSAVEEYVAGLMDVTFTLQGETGSIEMTATDMEVEADAGTAVEQAIAIGHSGNLIQRYEALQDLESEPLVLDMHLSVNKQSTAEKLYENAKTLAVGAVDNSLVRENGTFRYVEGKEGVEVDIVNSVYAINDFLESGWDGENNEIELVTTVVEPRGTEEELEQVQDLLGTYTTNYGSSSAGRAKNVQTGCSKVNGTILYPGDEFQLCSTVSPFTQENGYELAGTYQNGTTIESFGGGICQVATTLYNAVIRAELEITERYNHSMMVGYVQPSMDAAIAGTYKDLRFVNNTKTPIYIEGITSGGYITFNVYGKETRASNREISFESETLSTSEPQTQFTLDSSATLGSWTVTQTAHTGCVAQLWKIVKVDGVQQSRELFNKSSYQSSPKIVSIGTKGASESSLAVLRTAVASGNENAVLSAAKSLKSAESEKAEQEKTTEKENDKSTDKNSSSDKSSDKNSSSDKSSDKNSSSDKSTSKDKNTDKKDTSSDDSSDDE